MVKASDILPTWEATIKVKEPNGTILRVKTTVQAANSAMARRLLQAQYGKDAVMTIPTRIKIK
jgi:hypothetical protein